MSGSLGLYPGTYVRYRMRTLVCRVLVCPGLGAEHAKPASGNQARNVKTVNSRLNSISTLNVSLHVFNFIMEDAPTLLRHARAPRARNLVRSGARVPFPMRVVGHAQRSSQDGASRGHQGLGGSYLLGGGSYRIRILMYRDVSCMYPECILKDTRILSVS